VKHIDEKKVTWREFKRYFQKKYLTKWYFDRKMKDLYEIKFGNMMIDEYERRFLELLKYVPCIKDEQVNIQRYLSVFPSFISHNIQYDDPNTLEKTIRCAKYLYEKQRGRRTFQKSWEDKMKRKVEHRKKGAKEPFFKKTVQGQSTLQDPRMLKPLGNDSWKKPMQCWGYGGNPMHGDFPQRGDKERNMKNVQKYVTVEDMGIIVPRNYVVFDNKKVEFHSHMIEVEGNIND
jgi:hypothetical protein